MAVTVRRTACRESACEEDTLLPQMSNRGVRIVYWIAYSQADCTRFLTRDEFASIVLTAFNDTKKVQSYVVQWVFCNLFVICVRFTRNNFLLAKFGGTIL